MKCFQFCNGEKSDEPKTQKMNSVLPSFTGHERRLSGFELKNCHGSDNTTESRGLSQSPNFSEKPSNLKVFSFLELKQATKNFSNTAKLGEGGFGCVFKGEIKSSEDPSKTIDVAIKQLGKRGRQGHKEWVTEVKLLGVVEHPNLVKLIGYCAENDERGIQRLLIYEYMANGSVEDHLSINSGATLPWDIRLRIALDAARGLAYLHEEMDFQIIFRDLKSSNILLDEQWNAKLSDFGLARLGPPEGRTHVSTMVAGTMGYAAPEYVRTGHLKSKSDTWSYGVFLYELITGRHPLDRNRPRSEQKLLEWVRPYLSDCKKFHHILDPRLERRQTVKSAHQLSLVANRCLAKSPNARPKMSEVREMVNQVLVASTHTFNLQSPLKSVGPMQTTEESEAKGKRRITDVKTSKGGWLVCLWSSNVSKTC